MARSKDKRPKNPTVEDEDVTANSRAPGADRKPVAWSEIFSQHESSLTSHLDILSMVKSYLVSETDVFRTVSSMLDRTRELMDQFEAVKKEFLPRTTANNVLSGVYTRDLPRIPAMRGNGVKPENDPSESKRGQSEPLESQDPSTKSTPSFFFDSRPTPVSMPGKSGMGKKRSRREEDMMESEDAEDTTSSAQKRKRTNGAIPGHDQDVKDIIPVSMETEDISDEVARRLKLREERRKNRNTKPEKRKRESTNSNGSLSSPEDASKPKKKKVKSKNHVAKDSDTEPKEEKSKKKSKRRASNHTSASSSEDKRAKRLKNADRG